MLDASPGRDEDPVLWLRLLRSRRVGPVTFHRLLSEHGGVEAALRALPEIARAAGVEGYEVCPLPVVRAELTAGRAARAQLLLHGRAGYPARLRDLADAPPVLWARGEVGQLARDMVALVGARNASSLGLRMARRLSEGVSGAGLVVVSGLARGIDAEAHQGALAGGTVAVMAGGIDVIYPEENTALAARLAAEGCLLSEQPPGLHPQTRHFPLRNRIIAGLSRAVVVVEAAARSGSLITARDALDQGREVMAVPGHPFDARAAGCNQLIRDGATLVRGPGDVLEVLGLQHIERDHPPEVPAPVLPGPVPPARPLADVAALHGQILARLGPSPTAEDMLIRDLAMPPATMAAALLTLELDGRIQRAPGGLISRSDQAPAASLSAGG
ncbi:MAG: DNA-processing protein DprA [Paracoccaceae bacterium]